MNHCFTWKIICRRERTKRTDAASPPVMGSEELTRELQREQCIPNVERIGQDVSGGEISLKLGRMVVEWKGNSTLALFRREDERRGATNI